MQLFLERLLSKHNTNKNKQLDSFELQFVKRLAMEHHVCVQLIYVLVPTTSINDVNRHSRISLNDSASFSAHDIT